MARSKDISLGLSKVGRDGEGDALHPQNSCLPPLDTAALASPSPALFRQQDLPQGCTQTPMCPALHLNPICMSKSSVISLLVREKK